jgi:tRNA threonylcarbamoyladenosine biosynthesis protein TsaE
MLLIHSPAQMEEFGIQLAAKLMAGDLVILTGPLGAGKTALTKGIGRALGIEGITSPTFVIAKEYQGAIPLIHVDAYRLIGSNQGRFEFEDLDIDTRRERAITVIEWGSGIATDLDEQYLEIEISFGEGEEDRRIELHAHGERWSGLKL